MKARHRLEVERLRSENEVQLKSKEDEMDEVHRRSVGLRISQISSEHIIIFFLCPQGLAHYLVQKIKCLEWPYSSIIFLHPSQFYFLRLLKLCPGTVRWNNCYFVVVPEQYGVQRITHGLYYYYYLLFINFYYCCFMKTYKGQVNITKHTRNALVVSRSAQSDDVNR